MRKERVKKENEDGRVYVKVSRACGVGGLNERWARCEVCPTISFFDYSSDMRAIVLIKRGER